MSEDDQLAEGTCHSLKGIEWAIGGILGRQEYNLGLKCQSEPSQGTPTSSGQRMKYKVLRLRENARPYCGMGEGLA
jgi:hypothetical protein